MEEKKVGEVIKFFGKIGVAAIRLSEGSLKVGDKIHIVGHTTDVSQTVDIKAKGKVHVHGEPWNAETDEPIAAGERVIVTAVRGMTVKVKKERGGV